MLSFWDHWDGSKNKQFCLHLIFFEAFVAIWFKTFVLPDLMLFRKCIRWIEYISPLTDFMKSATLPCLISGWEELDSSMVELFWFIQTGITLCGNEIHQAPWIKENFNARWEKDGLLLFLWFLYSVNNFKIFRISELFAE